MSTTRPFSYNTGSTIPGTIQVGDLAVGYPTTGFTGMEWWNPAPWINADCGLDGCMPNPGIIWYWVR
jgi:hypothetical protein